MSRKRLSNHNDNEQRRLRNSLSFWHWFLRGLEDHRPGIRCLLNWKLAIHMFVGIGLALIISKPIGEVAAVVVLPLAGMLAALALTWTGNAHNVLQSPQLRKMTATVPGGVREYVNYFQLAITLVLFTLLLWAFVRLDGHTSWVKCLSYEIRVFSRAGLFAITSLAICECWSVMDTGRKLVISRMDIAAADAESTPE